MTKIQIEVPVDFTETDGDKTSQINITAITVEPITFMEFVQLWEMTPLDAKKPELSLQKRRILHQAHFMAGKERYKPTLDQLGTIHSHIARAIINALDHGTGAMGELLGDGDGLSKPVHYKLATPIGMGSAKSGDSSIRELEFIGKTYAEMEDVLAADNEMAQTVALIRTVAKPVGSALTIMPESVVERLTLGDGIGIMRLVLPRF